MAQTTPVQVHIPYKKLISEIDAIIEARINPEVYLDGEHLEEAVATTAQLDTISARLLDANLSITMHGPYMGTNPGSPDEMKRQETVVIYRKALHAARHLKPINIVLHAGYDDDRFNGDVEWWLHQSMKTWTDIVKESEDIGVTIAAENIFERNPFALRALAETVGSPNFGICIDTGHLNLFSEVPLTEWFTSIAMYVKEVHLHDNNGSSDEHLPVGEGEIDFEKLFEAIRENSPEAILTIEPHGDEEIRRGLAAIAKYL